MVLSHDSYLDLHVQKQYSMVYGSKEKTTKGGCGFPSLFVDFPLGHLVDRCWKQYARLNGPTLI